MKREPTTNLMLSALLTLTLVLASACGGEDTPSQECAVGSEGCACAEAMSCDEGLRCADATCVLDETTDDAGMGDDASNNGQEDSGDPDASEDAESDAPPTQDTGDDDVAMDTSPDVPEDATEDTTPDATEDAAPDATEDVDLAVLQLAVEDGDGQQGQVGEALALPLRVRVTDEMGAPVEGILVTFEADAGALEAPTPRSDAEGIASAGLWTLGTSVGEASVRASIDADTSVTFTSTALVGDLEVTFVGDPEALSAPSGREVALPFAVADAYGNLPDDPEALTLTLSVQGDLALYAPHILPVDAAGLATGRGLTTRAGTSTVVAALPDGAEGAVVVTCVPGVAVGLGLSVVGSDTAEVVVGQTLTLRADPVDANGDPTEGDLATIEIDGGGTLGAPRNEGSATLVDFTADTIAGVTHVNARTADASATLDLKRVADVPVEYTVVGGSTWPARVDNSHVFALEARDAYGNLLRDVTLPVVALGDDALRVEISNDEGVIAFDDQVAELVASLINLTGVDDGANGERDIALINGAFTLTSEIAASGRSISSLDYRPNAPFAIGASVEASLFARFFGPREPAVGVEATIAVLRGDAILTDPATMTPVTRVFGITGDDGRFGTELTHTGEDTTPFVLYFEVEGEGGGRIQTFAPSAGAPTTLTALAPLEQEIPAGKAVILRASVTTDQGTPAPRADVRWSVEEGTMSGGSYRNSSGFTIRTDLDGVTSVEVDTERTAGTTTVTATLADDPNATLTWTLTRSLEAPLAIWLDAGEQLNADNLETTIPFTATLVSGGGDGIPNQPIFFEPGELDAVGPTRLATDAQGRAMFHVRLPSDATPGDRFTITLSSVDGIAQSVELAYKPVLFTEVDGQLEVRVDAGFADTATLIEGTSRLVIGISGDSEHAGRHDQYLVDTDTQEVRNLTQRATLPSDQSAHFWLSGDGRWMVFYWTDVYTSNTNIQLTDLATGESQHFDDLPETDNINSMIPRASEQSSAAELPVVIQRFSDDTYQYFRIPLQANSAPVLLGSPQGDDEVRSFRVPSTLHCGDTVWTIGTNNVLYSIQGEARSPHGGFEGFYATLIQQEGTCYLLYGKRDGAEVIGVAQLSSSGAPTLTELLHEPVAGINDKVAFDPDFTHVGWLARGGADGEGVWVADTESWTLFNFADAPNVPRSGSFRIEFASDANANAAVSYTDSCFWMQPPSTEDPDGVFRRVSLVASATYPTPGRASRCTISSDGQTLYFSQSPDGVLPAQLWRVQLEGLAQIEDASNPEAEPFAFVQDGVLDQPWHAIRNYEFSPDSQWLLVEGILEGPEPIDYITHAYLVRTSDGSYTDLGPIALEANAPPATWAPDSSAVVLLRGEYFAPRLTIIPVP